MKRFGHEHPCQRYRADWERLRKAWFRKQPECQHCGRLGGSMHLDHIKPLHKIKPLDRITKKELLDITNVQTLCAACHRAKSDAEITKRPRPNFCACFHPLVDGRAVCGQAACIAEAATPSK